MINVRDITLATKHDSEKHQLYYTLRDKVHAQKSKAHQATSRLKSHTPIEF